MHKLGYGIWKESLTDPELMKALALAIYLKSAYKNSVITNFSYSKISKLTGVHRNTVKKRINTLGEHDLIELIGHNNNHFLFKRMRNKYANIDISKIDKSSLKSIELGLKALYIYDIQRKKDFVNHQIIIANTECKKRFCTKSEKAEMKRAVKFIRRCGLTEFKDNGISYSKLSKDLRMSNSDIMTIILYGMENNIFTCTHSFKPIVEFPTYALAHDFIKHHFELNGRMRIKKNGQKYIISLICANMYSIGEVVGL